MVGALGLYKSISISAQYATLQKYFSHPSLVMYSFVTPPIKLKLGQQIGGGLLIVKHLDLFLIQTGMCWMFFIQFYCAGSHTEHLWRCSKGLC
jgi:hypothetical protein